MSTPHRATTGQWLVLERQAETLGCASSRAILELRSRIEALEAAQLEAPMTELRAASAEARPTVKDSLTAGGGLVELVEEAIITGMVDGDRHAARAAIREVAVASADENPFDLLNEAAEHHGWDAAVAWLEQEADRG
jgi:hypothetical protein